MFSTCLEVGNLLTRFQVFPISSNLLPPACFMSSLDACMRGAAAYLDRLSTGVIMVGTLTI